MDSQTERLQILIRDLKGQYPFPFVFSSYNYCFITVSMSFLVLSNATSYLYAYVEFDQKDKKLLLFPQT